MSSSPAPAKRRRFRRLRKLLWIAAILLLLVRFTQVLWLEPLAARLAKSAGIELAWSDLDMTLWRGVIELRGLDVRLSAGTGDDAKELPEAPLLTTDYLALDVDMLALLKLDLRVTRLSVGTAVVEVERDADGKWAAERLAGAPSAEPETALDEAPGRTSLQLPFSLERLDVVSLELHLVDAYAQVEQRVQLEVTFRELGSAGIPGMLDLEVVAPGWIEALRLSGELSTAEEHLSLHVDGQLLDLSPATTCELATAFGVIGLTPLAHEVNGRFRVSVSAVPEAVGEDAEASSPRLHWSAALLDVDLNADGLEAVGLKELRAEVIGSDLGLVTAKGLDVTLARGAEDDLRIAGFSLALTLAEAEVVAEVVDQAVIALEEAAETVVEAAEEALDASSEEPLEPDSTAGSGFRPGQRFGPFEATDFRVHWQDHSASLASPASVELQLVSLSSGVIEIGASEPVPLELKLAAPGILESAVLRGVLTAGTEEQLELEIELLGLAPSALEPYLSAAGIESELRAGSLAFAASARRYGPRGDRHLDATLRDLALADGETLVGVEKVSLVGFELESGDLVLESLEIDGPAAAFTRRADGSSEFAGLRFLPGTSSTASNAAPAPVVAKPAAPEPAPRAKRRFSIGRIAVDGVQLNLRDEMVSPALSLLPEKLELVVEGLVLGDPSAPAATLHLELSQAGLADSLAIDANLDQLPAGSLLLDAKVTGRGLSSTLLEPYLVAAGIEGTLVDGRLDLGLQGSFRPAMPGAATTSFALDGFSFAVGETMVASAGEISASVFTDVSGMSLSKVLVASPELWVERRPDGLWSFAGLTWVGSQEAPVATAESPTSEPAAANPPGKPAQLGGLLLREALVHVWDRAVPGEPRFDVFAGAEVGRLDFGPLGSGATTPTTPIEVDLRIPGVVEELELVAELRAEPTRPFVSGSLRLAGIHGPAFAPYMPPGTEMELETGHLGLSFQAEAESGVAGVPGEWSIRAEALDLILEDGTESLFRVTRLGLDAPRLSTKAIQIDELALEGARLDARRDADGVLHILGLALGPAPATTPAGNGSATPVPPDNGGAPLTKPLRPLLGLESLRLELAHFGFVDESLPGRTPLDLSLQLENSAPWLSDLAGDEDALEPLLLRLTGRATPVVEALELELQLAPFLSEPHLELSLLLSGLSGAGMAAALPQLAETLDATAMEGGSFAASLSADLAVTRRGPFGLDLARGISGEVELTDVAFRLTPEGPVELGFAALAADIRKASGAGIELATLELNDPVGRVEILPTGLSVGGLVLLTPEPEVPVEVVGEAAATPGSADATDATDASETAEVAVAGPLPAPFDFSINEVYASGLDFVFRDTTADPPVVLPLKDLDLSLNGFTTRALREPLPMRFELFLGAGKTELPERVEAANVLTGFLGSAAAIVTGGNDKFKTQLRPAFGSIDASGRVTLYPAPTGWASLSVASLELPVFRGSARKGGVDLGDGLLNLDVSVRLLGERGASVSTKARAAYLSLSEPPGGPISTYLKLPAPLDTVLFLLRDENGDVVLPLNLTVGADGGIKGLGTEITKTIGLVVGEAIASSPLRIVGGVLDMTGIMRDEPIVLPEQPARALFLPGSTELTGSAKTALAATFKLLRKNSELELDLVHAFGAQDLTVLSTRANPSPDACRALALRLGVERDVLISAREDKSTDLRARFAAGDNQALEASREELLELDGELARTEEALDTLLSLLRPGAERRAKRRTKAAAMLLAESRLESVRALIAAQPIESIGSRLRVRRARFSEPDPETPGGSVFVVPR